MKPVLNIRNANGNAPALLSKAYKAAKDSGMDQITWMAIETEAKRGDYDHLLKTLQKYFEVIV